MPATREDIETIGGAFAPLDMDVFELMLDHGEGDLAELGVLYGKSAALVGSYQRPGETFTVADLWELPAGDDANAEENASSYPGLTRADFEDNYRRVVGPNLPVIVQAESSTITNVASHGTHRFVHIDASHLHQHVVLDIDAASTLLHPGGVVAFDDYRSAHAPGVAAAIWGAVRTDDLRPFAVTDMKLYATWGDPQPHLDRVTSWANSSSAYNLDIDSVAGHEIARLSIRRVAGRFDSQKKYIPPALLPAVSKLRQRLMG